MWIAEFAFFINKGLSFQLSFSSLQNAEIRTYMFANKTFLSLPTSVFCYAEAEKLLCRIFYFLIFLNFIFCLCGIQKSELNVCFLFTASYFPFSLSTFCICGTSIFLFSNKFLSSFHFPLFRIRNEELRFIFSFK